ncbi:hypothetical protein IFM89_036000 [Coptis chinensis]|uniref:Uncharacterized protein n=1 Tax=Coptis chinensis TaxID=261450 RepID=A0A835MDG0_9MAGN|nr:hypothetical protein IFM89_036000 [Coptis chinensis]
MAANYARRTPLFVSSFLSVGCYTKSPSSFASKLGSFVSANRPTSSRLSRHLSRIPVELGGVQSLMPLHSVTASVLLTSMLSCKGGNWGWLSEDYAKGHSSVLWAVDS